LAWAWHGRRRFCGGGHRSRSRRELTRFGMRRSRDRTRTAEGHAKARHLGTVARRALILLRAELFEEGAGRDKNAVARRELIVGGRISQLHNLPVTNRNHDPAPVRSGRPTQNNVAAGGAIGKSSRGDDGVEDRLTSLQGERPRR